MNKLQTRRLYFFSIFLLGLGLAVGLILFALKQNINVFVTPSQITAKQRGSEYAMRLGGLVKLGSIKHDATGLGVSFIVTDYKQELPVHYQGILPDLFREGKGVIAEGTLNASGVFTASQVLAKHDENYLPKNVYRALREGKQTA